MDRQILVKRTVRDSLVSVAFLFNGSEPHGVMDRAKQILAEADIDEMNACIEAYKEAVSDLPFLSSRIFQGYEPLIEPQSDAYMESYVRRVGLALVKEGVKPVYINMTCAGANLPCSCNPPEFQWDYGQLAEEMLAAATRIASQEATSTVGDSPVSDSPKR